jgi:Sulfotransferase family
MPQKLLAQDLIEQAQRNTGLKRFDSDSFRDGLEVLLADVNAGSYTAPGFERLRGAIVGALAARLKTTAFLDEHPELLKRPIERPLFIFGIPRTGTTLLSNLLATDPSRRSPLTWEIDNPIPPPTKDTLYTDPRVQERLEQDRKMLAARPELAKYYRNSATYPNECMFFMLHDFKGLIWEGRGKVPRYREWLFNEADLTPTYQYHKRFLQLLQADAPGIWNLKMPSHALWIPTLLKVYPDARLVWTHRDPLTATASFCSLMSMSHRNFMEKVDGEWVGQNYSSQAVEHARRIMDFRDQFGEERVIDLHYADLMREPIETVRKLYKALGDDYSAEAEARMKAWLDDNPQGKFGRHEYKLAQYGLTPDQVRGMFERYLSRYEVESEG